MQFTSEPPTIISIVLALIGVGAGLLKCWQMTQRRPISTGSLSVGELEMKIARIVERTANERIIPILEELKEIAQRQNDIQQDQHSILVELATIGRIRNQSSGRHC